MKQSDKGLDLKKTKKVKPSYKKKSSNLSHNIAELDREMDEKRMIKSSGEKKGNKEKKRKVEATKSDLDNFMSDDKANGDDQKGKLSKKRKANKVGASQSGLEKADKLNIILEGDLSDQKISQENTETKTSTMRKKRRKDEKRKNIAEEKSDEIHKEVEDGIREDNVKLKDTHKKNKRKKSHALSVKDEKVLEEKVKPEEDDVYEMSSGDEDCTRGMKKWITEYHRSRPGIKILQDQIDDFITAHEEKEEKAREDREAQAAEGGWTVVVHHKGRKKTTETESGTAVGSVAQAAVMENMAKKKNNQVGIDFYRFQKREARMNEIMALQSKFEQDKKRMQQMKAARKFRPY